MRLALAPLVVALLAAAAPPAERELEVEGSVLATTPRLQVSVVVTNPGDRPVPSLEIEGELLGQRRKAEIVGGIVAGGRGSVVLDFGAAPARPGVHALVLLLANQRYRILQVELGDEKLMLRRGEWLRSHKAGKVSVMPAFSLAPLARCARK